MQLRNRFYPYPVIVEGGEYYSDSSFSSTVSQTMEGYNVKITMEVQLNDATIANMIDRGEAVFVHHIECPQTCFRDIVKTKAKQYDYLLKDTDVNGVVQICSFIIANCDIDKYTSDSFSPDYRGWKFNIEKGCVLAVGNQYNIRISKQRDDLANTASIFSIVKNTDPTETMITIDLGQQKIVITLPETTYNQYSSVQDYIDIQPVMHSMLIIPALTYALSELRQAGDQLYEYEENRWYRGLKKACSAIGIDLNENSLKVMDIMKVPQQLLDSPISKAIAYCAMGGASYED